VNRLRTERAPSLGEQLLADIRLVFESGAAVDRYASTDSASALCRLEDAPWSDLRGKSLDARGLAARLRPFGIRPRSVRIGVTTPKGYLREDFGDAWNRYLPTLSSVQIRQQPQQEPRQQRDNGVGVADVADVSDVAVTDGKGEAPTARDVFEGHVPPEADL
jgi:hypothetical protein